MNHRCFINEMTSAGNEKLKPAHPVQEDFEFLILINIVLFILYTSETFLKVIVFFGSFCFCNFEVFRCILVL